ncbi:type Z 30S ribosomal protein S14 [Candidatus Shapirobacteria bacterium]|nr:type Z 30S ribosomal protein S14 [Candidatus Shapirobacteria bacterium]
MARKAKIIKQLNLKRMKFSVRHRNRCSLCGRARAYLRLFGLCRLCFRELAHKGELPGVKKASW